MWRQTDTPKIQHQKEVEVRVERTSGQKPHLIKNGRSIKCNTANCVPFVVPGLSTGSSCSSTPTSPTSLSQEAEHPASTRSESSSSTVCVNPSHEPPEIDQEKHGDNENVRGNRCVICQDGSKNLRRIWWMEVFQLTGTHPRVLLVNQLQSRGKKWYRTRTSTVFCTHFPKDKDFEICKRTKITRAPCMKRTGTAVPRAEKFGDLITADHKVLSEGCESRNNHRNAVVVQDLDIQWIQSYPCKTKTS